MVVRTLTPSNALLLPRLRTEHPNKLALAPPRAWASAALKWWLAERAPPEGHLASLHFAQIDLCGEIRSAASSHGRVIRVESIAQNPRHCLGAGGDPDFAVHGADVALHGVDREIARLGDLFVG